MEKEKPTFEELLAELESIAEQLESQDISLDESIELFQKGTIISKECSEMLKNAKQKVEKITDVGSETDDK